MNWLAYSVGILAAIVLFAVGVAALSGAAAAAYHWQAGAPYILGALAVAALAVLFAVRRRAAPRRETIAPDDVANHLLMAMLNGAALLALTAIHLSPAIAFYGVLALVAGAFAWVLWLTSGRFV